MSKYAPLYRYLAAQPATNTAITLRFDQVEQILGARLPPSAHIYHPWWANEAGGRHVQAHAWTHAGWLVDGVDLAGERVHFRRVHAWGYRPPT